MAKLEDHSNQPHKCTILGMRNRRDQVASAEQNKTLPLHSKKVATMDIEGIKSNLMLPSAVELVNSLMASMRHNPAAPGYLPSACFRVPDKDADRIHEDTPLERLGTVDTVDLTTCTVVRYFTKLEDKTEITYGKRGRIKRRIIQRRRPITWANEWLRYTKYVSNHKLKSVAQYRQLALGGTKAVTFDLAASFYQVPLPPESRFVMVTESGVVYRLTRMPYGVDCASEIMHIIVSTLAGDPKYAKPIEGIPVSDFDAFNAIHIDNAFFSGPHAKQRAAHFKAQCTKYNVTLNVDPGNEFAWEQEFVGLSIDLKNKRVSLKPGYGDRIDVEGMRTNEDLERIMGKVLYAGAVLRVEWSEFYFLIKQYRRILSKCGKHEASWKDGCKLWPTSQNQLLKLVGIIRENAPVQVHPSVLDVTDQEPHAIVVTDSTLEHFGGMLLRPGELPVAFGESFGVRFHDINFAEATAALCMLTRFREELRNLRVLLLIDNTTAETKINRGIQHKMDHDGIGRAIEDLALANKFKLRLRYINTKENPADSVSRQLEPDVKLAEAVMQQAWGTKMCRRNRAWGRSAVDHAVR